MHRGPSRSPTARLSNGRRWLFAFEKPICLLKMVSLRRRFGYEKPSGILEFSRFLLELWRPDQAIFRGNMQHTVRTVVYEIMPAE
jgi:hypothetical protein